MDEVSNKEREFVSLFRPDLPASLIFTIIVLKV